MNLKKVLFLLYFIMVALDIYGHISKHYWLVYIFKALEMPLLAYYYYQAKAPKLEILDKLLLLYLGVSCFGINVSYLFNQNAVLINFITIIFIIEGQINLFILSKLNSYLGTNNDYDLWRIGVSLIVALGFIYIIFPKFATITQVLSMIVMLQLGLTCIYGLFKKGINMNISWSIMANILSNILSVSIVFLKPLIYDYLWIMGLVYISKILFVEGVLKTSRSLNRL
ncbi:hypothetical protein [Emticicia sp. SJ17W-69]|uniref:hypothetical protein n=1 Tax=Emticicia sp. SJ17W-69 TaxID=3421657 RepID=UPI003EBFCDA6